MEKKLTKNEKGITLVALIITIIVLLILAIVSIRAIKDGGILSKTQTAKETYSEAEEKEKIKLAINQAAIDGIGTIKESYLTPALNEQFGENNWEYTQKKEGEYLVVKINASQRKYVINVDGTVDIPEDIIVDGEDMFTYSDDNTTVTGLSDAGRKKIEQQVKKGSEIKLIIPATHNGVQVIRIGANSFSGRRLINGICYTKLVTNIEVPNSVTSIGQSAFDECTSLTSVTIPNSVTSIGEYAFSGCTSLTNITIPNSVTSIGQSAFANCESLTSVVIQSGNIGKFAFSGCTSLTSVTIGENVKSIGYQAFYVCGFTKIEIPQSVTTITDGWIFYNCKNLTDIYCPGNASKPDGWNPNWESGCSAEVHWGESMPK